LVDAQVAVEKGLRLANRGEYQKAIVEYERAISLNPHDREAWFGRGDASLQLGKFDEAISDYDAALAINPKNANILGNRGLAKYRKGDDEGAIADYTAALGMSNLPSDLKAMLAELYGKATGCCQGRGGVWAAWTR